MTDERSGARRRTAVTLKAALGYYEYYSERLSTIQRQIAFAGLALIWILRRGTPLVIPSELFLPALLIVIALVCDLMQYAWATFIWSHLHWDRRRDPGVTDETTIYLNSRWDAPTTVLFWAKVGLLGAAYWYLGFYLKGNVLE